MTALSGELPAAVESVGCRLRHLGEPGHECTVSETGSQRGELPTLGSTRAALESAPNTVRGAQLPPPPFAQASFFGIPTAWAQEKSQSATKALVEPIEEIERFTSFRWYLGFFGGLFRTLNNGMDQAGNAATLLRNGENWVQIRRRLSESWEDPSLWGDAVDRAVRANWDWLQRQEPTTNQDGEKWATGLVSYTIGLPFTLPSEFAKAFFDGVKWSVPERPISLSGEVPRGVLDRDVHAHLNFIWAALYMSTPEPVSLHVTAVNGATVTLAVDDYDEEVVHKLRELAASQSGVTVDASGLPDSIELTFPVELPLMHSVATVQLPGDIRYYHLSLELSVPLVFIAKRFRDDVGYEPPLVVDSIKDSTVTFSTIGLNQAQVGSLIAALPSSAVVKTHDEEELVSVTFTDSFPFSDSYE